MSSKQSLVFTIHRMTHQIALALEKADLGVDQAEAHVLAHLAESGEATVNEIHRAFGHKRSTLTSILDRLEARQLLERTLNETDRRSFLVKLTPAGKPVARKVQNWMRRLESEVMASASEEAVDALQAVAKGISKLAVAPKAPGTTP